MHATHSRESVSSVVQKKIQYSYFVKKQQDEFHFVGITLPSE